MTPKHLALFFIGISLFPIKATKLYVPEKSKEVHGGVDFSKRFPDLKPVFLIRKCVDCALNHPTNIIIKRLRDEHAPLFGTLKIARLAESRKRLHSLILPVFALAHAPPMSTPSSALNPNKNGEYRGNVRSLLLNSNSRRMLGSENYVHQNNNLDLDDENHSSVLSDEITSEENNKSVMATTTGKSIVDRNDSNSNDSTESSLCGHNNGLCRFARSLDTFERKIYNATFTKLVQISPANRKENGVSFVQSALFVNLALLALSLKVDERTKAEIDESLGFFGSDASRPSTIREVVSSLPTSEDGLKLRWSTRLVLGGTQAVPGPAAAALALRLDRLNGTSDAAALAEALNRMIEEDSGGAMHSTFSEDELSGGMSAALLSVVYLRARWRAAPTLLNGTRPFRDGAASNRRTRMMRINDVMRYADVREWDAQALEISYATTGLSLVVVVPRDGRLRPLSSRLATMPLWRLTERMTALRVAATLPLYTLRMTLLLPNKLEAMGIKRLVDTNCSSDSDGIRLSHAVQRLMFWSEAGRYAFKDDGIEWDAAPQMEVVVDRPYVFYVRWHNITLMSGNFVL